MKSRSAGGMPTFFGKRNLSCAHSGFWISISPVGGSGVPGNNKKKSTKLYFIQNLATPSPPPTPNASSRKQERQRKLENKSILIRNLASPPPPFRKKERKKINVLCQANFSPKTKTERRTVCVKTFHWFFCFLSVV
jgi:hypothetical protein